MRVKLSSRIPVLNVDLGLVNKTDDLNVVRSSHELDAFEGASWDETGAVSGFGAMSDFLAFGIGNERIGFGRGPEAEIIEAVQEAGLAERVLVLSCRIALVEAKLRSTDTVICVGLIGDGGVRKALVGEWSGVLCKDFRYDGRSQES